MQVPHWSLAQSFEPHRSHTALIPEHSFLGISGSHGKRAEICIEVPSVCPGVFLAHPSHIPCPSMGCVLFMNPSNPLVLPPLKELREGAGHKCKFNREITLGYHWIQKDVPDIPHFGFGNFHVQILWLKRWKDFISAPAGVVPSLNWRGSRATLHPAVPQTGSLQPCPNGGDLCNSCPFRELGNAGNHVEQS